MLHRNTSRGNRYKANPGARGSVVTARVKDAEMTELGPPPICHRRGCVSPSPEIAADAPAASPFLAGGLPVLFVHFKFNFAFKNSIGSSVKH